VRNYISKKTKTAVEVRAAFCCEYCKASGLHTPATFHIEHIFPVVEGGSDAIENLAYSCGDCNAKKYTKTTVTDPETGINIPLFHPRKDEWNEHFKWGNEGLYLIGITLKGKLTVQTLDMNREKLLNYRRALIALGVHPPK